MKVLLIYPEFPDTFWSFKHALKIIRKKSAQPPLGLLTVAALLPERWEKRLVDMNVAKLSDADLEWADLVFISGMTVQRQSATAVIDRCKGLGKKVVAGGPLFTSEHERFPDVDHFVLNEAELTLPPFLTDLAAGRANRIYATGEYADITTSPVPLWHLLDMKRYASMSLQITRGCPYQCDFCNVTALFGHRPRLKTSRQIIAELDVIYSRGWRGSVFVVDDNFIGNRRFLKSDLLPALIRWRRGKKGIIFYTEVSINLADDEELMRQMAAAGFDQVFIGIETPDEQGLAECRKRQNANRDLVADVKRIQRTGLQVMGGFIVGFDSDTPSIFQRQIQFIQKSGIVMAMVGLLQAPAGTKLHERLKREGRLIGRMSGDNADGATNIVTLMNPETLKAGYRSILDHIYTPKHYYQRVRTFLREYKAPQFSVPFDFGQFRTLLRTSLHLGILGKERFHYWKLLLWTRVRRPELMPVAVTLAIYGHHFRKINELRLP